MLSPAEIKREAGASAIPPIDFIYTDAGNSGAAPATVDEGSLLFSHCATRVHLNPAGFVQCILQRGKAEDFNSHKPGDRPEKYKTRYVS